MPRAEIEAYCAARGLAPRLDATNLDPAYFRNRLRHELLPQLETYNPNLRAVLARTAEVAAGEHELLSALSAAVWARTARVGEGRVWFERAAWRALTAAEQRLLLREAVRRLLPARRDIDFAPLEHAVRFSRAAAPGGECDVLGGLRLSISYAQIELAPWDALAPAVGQPLLDAEGALTGGWRFEVETRPPGAVSPAQIVAEASAWAWAVFAAGPGPFRLRARRPGDRFQPLGLGGHSVKVADFMINAKIDEARRDHWPLVVRGDDIAWVAGLRLDERFRVTPQTAAVVRLSFFKEPAPDE
jgi:tRNA(Ile)-lysidine synthase